VSCNYWLLGGTLAVALLLRLPGIAWGLPPVTEQVRKSDLRSSYAFDEDDLLSGAAKADVRRLDFDPHEYHWGTLHIDLVLLALDGAQAVGVFHTPWRTAYYNLADGDFVRVYVVGRLVAVAAALLTVWLLFAIGGWAGAFAAMLVAVSPSHVLQSDQVRVDVTMTALVVLTLLLAIRIGKAGRDARPIQFMLLGMAAGLSIAAKYSAFSVVAAIALAALCLARVPWRGVVAGAGGTGLGFIAGAPYILIKPWAYYNEAVRSLTLNAQVPADFLIPPAKLLGMHALNLARFSMGPLALLLAVAGIVWMARRRSPFDWIVFAAIVGYTAVLFPLRWPLIRYDLPLTVLLGLCAGVALERLSIRRLPIRLCYLVTAAALVIPLAGSIAQIHWMRSPHPADLMLRRILDIVPPGNAISRVMPESPPLDRKIFPMGPSMYSAGFAANPPVWALTSDLNDDAYPAATRAVLGSSYDQVAHFDSPGILAWSTLGEAASPHDWKYTHCNFTLLRKKSP
jgi:hypothetical protein